MYCLPICDLEDDGGQKEDEENKLMKGLSERYEFSYRVTVKGLPEGQDFMEAVIRGINKRKDLGLFQNYATYYGEL